jgi:hypothetical protein
MLHLSFISTCKLAYESLKQACIYFQSKLFLHMCMMGEVMAILAPFLSLAFVYNASKVLHMITLNLDK